MYLIITNECLIFWFKCKIFSFYILFKNNLKKIKSLRNIIKNIFRRYFFSLNNFMLIYDLNVTKEYYYGKNLFFYNAFISHLCKEFIILMKNKLFYFTKFSKIVQNLVKACFHLVNIAILLFEILTSILVPNIY